MKQEERAKIALKGLTATKTSLANNIATQKKQLKTTTAA